jgi:glucokinase
MSEINQTWGDIYLDLSIGGTKCSVIVGDGSFSIKQKIVFETRRERGYYDILFEFQKHIKSLS